MTPSQLKRRAERQYQAYERLQTLAYAADKTGDKYADAWANAAAPFKVGDTVRYPVLGADYGRRFYVSDISGRCHSVTRKAFWRAHGHFVTKDGDFARGPRSTYFSEADWKQNAAKLKERQ